MEVFKKRKMTVCNTHSRCIGSMYGGIYIYEDGSEDRGRVIEIEELTPEVKRIYQEMSDIAVKEYYEKLK